MPDPATTTTTKWWTPFEEIFKWCVIIVLATILWKITGVAYAVESIFNWLAVQSSSIPSVAGFFRFLSQHNWLATVILCGIIYFIFWGRRMAGAVAAGGTGQSFADQTIKLADHFVIKPIWWVISSAICLLNIALAVIALYVLDPNAPMRAVLTRAGKGALFGIAVCICGLMLAGLLGWTEDSVKGKKILVGIYVVSLIVCLWRVYIPPTSTTAKVVSGRITETNNTVLDSFRSTTPGELNSAVFSTRQKLIQMQIVAHTAELEKLQAQWDVSKPDPKFLDPNYVRGWQAKIAEHVNVRTSLSAQLKQNDLAPDEPKGQKKWFAAIAILIVMLLIVAALFKWAITGKTERIFTAIIAVLIFGVIIWYSFGPWNIKIPWMWHSETISAPEGIVQKSSCAFALAQTITGDVLQGRVIWRGPNNKRKLLDPSQIWTITMTAPGPLCFEGAKGGGKIKIMY